jgi:hypothetical protein
LEWNAELEDWESLVDELMREFQVGDIINLKRKIRHPEVNAIYDAVIMEWRRVVDREDDTAWVLKIAANRNYRFIEPRQLADTFTLEKAHA